MEYSIDQLRPPFPMHRIRPPSYRPDKPFVAEFAAYIMAKSPSGSTTETHRINGSMVRDKLGRTEVKFWRSGSGSNKILGAVILTDPILRTITTAAGDGFLVTEDPLDPIFDDQWSPTDPVRLVKSEGGNTILGIRCQKLAFAPLVGESSPSAIDECWISDELALVMQDTQDSAAALSVWEIIRVELREPLTEEFHQMSRAR